ncbi:hypothetical protein DL764_003043 [Monosporascus ibericus]|uniref:Uncharacterized protein n=1 Tax=Monosporascus ibericus TaxID=155417 RepID=A0A4V1XBL4_9PEZI|nr:hypothetical protein DL764_003043 [Monosporascus ibericus]
MRRQTIRFLALSLALRPAACSFSLDTVVTDYWYYVHNHLADTTSQACLDAYSILIDCDMTLLGKVSSNSPNFNPGPEDLERTCVQACGDSLESWVVNVKAVCTQPGDRAPVISSVRPRPQVPVVTVGEVFQYDSGWCDLNCPMNEEWARDDFACGNGCAEQFFTLAHDLPASQYQFRHIYELLNKSNWWKTQFELGWETMLQCRRSELSEGTSRSSRSATTQDPTSTVTTKSMWTIYAETTSMQSPVHNTSSLSESTRTFVAAPETTSVNTELPARTPNSAAGRIRAPLWGMW